ncbi:MAG: cyanophycin synthetase [Patescibacteria group bacterium]|nr:cyanophycin synthetase [Patescibacteria group bacterium]
MKKSRPFVGQLLQRIAREAGVEVIVEPEFGYVGQIVCPNGKKHYFRNTNFDLNTLGATEIARDKGYANFFMARLGYPVIEGQAFYSKKWCKGIGSQNGIDEAYDYALSLGLPVIVKPNSKSQGDSVCKAHTKREFHQACQKAFQRDKVILVQRVVHGKDYRIVVLDGEIISAYQRLPLTITGDGIRTISELLAIKQETFYSDDRDTELPLDDYRVKQRLARMKLSFQTVLPDGQDCQLLDNANLSTGGDAVDVTDKIHPGYREIAVKLTADMGLRYCGVDLMVENDLTQPLGKYHVIEINAAPGIDNYSASGKDQARIVEQLYIKVLKAVAKL